MAPEKRPAFRFYARDFLTDEHCTLMTYPQRGVYITLLCYCWLEQSIPADLRALAQLTKIPFLQFQKLWTGSLPRCFQPGEPGRLIQKRLEAERAKQDQFSKQQSNASGMRWHRSGNASALPSASPRDENAHEREKEKEHGDPERESEGKPAVKTYADEAAFDAFRAHWKQLYGYECSVLVSPLAHMQLQQQLTAHGSPRMLEAMAAYFASTEPYIRNAKHPLALFLRDPLRYLAAPVGADRQREAEAAEVLAIVKKRDAGDWS